MADAGRQTAIIIALHDTNKLINYFAVSVASGPFTERDADGSERLCMFPTLLPPLFQKGKKKNRKGGRRNLRPSRFSDAAFFLIRFGVPHVFFYGLWRN